MNIIYLDNAATVKPMNSVINECFAFNDTFFYNPSAGYRQALDTNKQLQNARRKISDKLKVDSNTIFFTSGATESNNWALNKGHKIKSALVVTTLAEHPSVYNVVKQMKACGVGVEFLPLLRNGCVDYLALQNICQSRPISMLSIIHTCGQTGAVNDIKRAVEIVKLNNPKALVHSDGVQSYGKIAIDLIDMGVDMYSISMHKIGAFKGLGVLYIKSGVNIAPFIVGGEQQENHRAGTQNTIAIMSSVGAIKEYFQTNKKTNYVKMRTIITDKLLLVEGIGINGNGCDNYNTNNNLINTNTNQALRGVPHIISVSIAGLKAEVLQTALCDKGVIVGIGSACNVKHSENRVLEAMGVSQKSIEGSIRISLGPHNTLEEIDRASDIIVDTVRFMRKDNNA